MPTPTKTMTPEPAREAEVSGSWHVRMYAGVGAGVVGYAVNEPVIVAKESAEQPDGSTWLLIETNRDPDNNLSGWIHSDAIKE